MRNEIYKRIEELVDQKNLKVLEKVTALIIDDMYYGGDGFELVDVLKYLSRKIRIVSERKMEKVKKKTIFLLLDNNGDGNFNFPGYENCVFDELAVAENYARDMTNYDSLKFKKTCSNTWEARNEDFDWALWKIIECRVN